jgi:hypothetical protein
MFVNVYRAELKERQFTDLIRRMSMLPEDKVYELNVMLKAKKSVNKTTSSSGTIGKVLSGLGPSGYVLNSRINSCLSAIDRTIDNNIIGLMGVVADATGISMLLDIQERLGNDFVQIVRTLGNVQNFGPNALYQLQSAVFEGIQNTIFDVVATGTQAVNEVIDGITDAAFCALMPGLQELQDSLGGLLGGIASIEEAVSSLTNSVTTEINTTLYALQSEINQLSDRIAGGLFGYASTRTSTCASRPDSQLGIRDAIRSSIC